MSGIGAAAGFITGLLGGGGGIILVPMLTLLTDLEDDAVFPASISIILPICLICIVMSTSQNPVNLKFAMPYLLGSAVGGYLAGKNGPRIPVVWLHRILGIFLLWGGFRYLC